MVENAPSHLSNGTGLESTGLDGDTLKRNTPSAEESTSNAEIETTAATKPPFQHDGEDPHPTIISTDADPLPADFDEGDAEAVDTEMNIGGSKKKRKRRPKSKRGLNAPTGFEEYYVDAPLTPGEHAEEKSIYDPLYRFTQRIETAIQRFSAKRRLDSQTKLLFDRYLLHGGVQIGPKMFTGGLDTELLKDRNAAEIAEIAATHYVDSDKLDAFEIAHVVDFEGCLQSFLSGQFMNEWELVSEEQTRKFVGIIRNFLNYLLHHDVCPEYKDQIDAARSLCDKATKEIWNITKMRPLLPGDFNMACSEIFGGMYQGLYSADSTWMDEADKAFRSGISREQARNVFKIGIAANANDEMFPKYRQQLSEKKCQLISSEETGFEITEIIHADETALSLYAQPQSTGLKILGRMKARTWLSPNTPDEDLTEEEEAYLKMNPPPIKDYEFWVEEEILEKCAVGMKIEATIRETSFGLTYFDAINGIHCSFYQMIPNELMGDWREIEKEWLPMKYNKHKVAKRSVRDQDGSVGSTEGQDAPEDQKGLGLARAGFDKATEDIREDKQSGDEPESAGINKGLVVAGTDKDYGELPPEVEDQPEEDGAGSRDSAEAGFGVEVYKAGAELRKVPGNADAIIEENFDVKRT